MELFGFPDQLKGQLALETDRKEHTVTNHQTIPSSIYMVAVTGREDGIYAFSAEREAERFADGVANAGSEPIVTQVPLNLTPDHTDALIEAEVDA